MDATDEESAEFYQQNPESFQTPESVTASHILIGFTPEDTDETKAEKKAQLESIKADLAAGASFEELAKANSTCPSGQQGGDLGTFPRGQMVPEFEAAAFIQPIGEVGDVVETQFGYHLIKTTDRSDADIRPLAEVKDQLASYLTGQKKQEALLAYIDELKSQADIEFTKPELDEAATE